MMPDSTAAEHFNFASALLDCVACGTIVVSPARRIIAFNECAQRQLGLRASDVLGNSVSLLPREFQTVVEQTFQSGRGIAHQRVPLASPDHDDLQIRSELAQHGSEPLSVLIEVQNVGQGREIAANLEHLDRLAGLGLLGSSAAHEIKNALVSVRTFVELLHERHKDDDLSVVVAHEILRIDTMLKQVLNGATRDELTLAPLDLHRLINDSMNLLRHQFQARSIQVRLQLDAVPDRINGDDRQLRHAFLNVLMNSQQAVSNGGSISVLTENVVFSGRPCIRVDFMDTGSGIRPEHLPRLFSPFFTTKKEGTGLGLAITRRIIEAHGGDISAQSKEASGTTFSIVLPLI
jgi:signal transduction histidine kinase